MMHTVKKAFSRLHRSVAQHGPRKIAVILGRRLLSGNFSLQPAKRQRVECMHPFDKAHPGIDTGGMIEGAQLAAGHAHDIYSTAYYGTAPSLFQNVMDRWLAQPNQHGLHHYTFIDVGSGKGRVVLLASEYSFSHCVGIELNRQLHGIAFRNIQHWTAQGRPVTSLESVCMDATAYSFPMGPCLLYLFNPFAAVVLERLLDAITSAFEKRPGQLDLIYVNPERAELLRRRPGFQLLWEGHAAMSSEDKVIDLLYLGDESGRKANGIEGMEPCSMWRWIGTRPN